MSGEACIKIITQSLDDLAEQMNNNPNALKALQKVPCITLRKDTSSGSKFWQMRIIQEGCQIRWGRTNTKGTTKLIPVFQCMAKNAAQEARLRALEKLRDGYELIPYGTALP
ncbi:WGR domain-containing protein [Desulfovibrio cuneatus]|uniref:WGR domain-containing protein n=1 Tax=Desulfovibrio cuneatus TaxID=159728 RepID=UPI000409B521|nr:WGR domain-containing protein [Desulfovibrio cuneatus]